LHLGPDPPAAGHPQAALQLHLAVEPAVHRQVLSVQRPRKDLLGPEDGPSFFSNARHNALLLLRDRAPGARPNGHSIYSSRAEKPMIRPRPLASFPGLPLSPLVLSALLLAVGPGRPTAAEGAAAATIDLGEGRAPRVAVDDASTVAVVYACGDAVFVRVAKRGASAFGPEVRVAEVPGLLAGRRRGPQIAISASGMAVSAIGGSGDLRAWTSRDEGTTWSGPVPA